jgi:hypothetical protein
MRDVGATEEELPSSLLAERAAGTTDRYPPLVSGVGSDTIAGACGNGAELLVGILLSPKRFCDQLDDRNRDWGSVAWSEGWCALVSDTIAWLVVGGPAFARIGLLLG